MFPKKQAWRLGKVMMARSGHFVVVFFLPLSAFLAIRSKGFRLYETAVFKNGALTHIKP